MKITRMPRRTYRLPILVVILVNLVSYLQLSVAHSYDQDDDDDRWFGTGSTGASQPPPPPPTPLPSRTTLSSTVGTTTTKILNSPTATPTVVPLPNPTVPIIRTSVTSKQSATTSTLSLSTTTKAVLHSITTTTTNPPNPSSKLLSSLSSSSSSLSTRSSLASSVVAMTTVTSAMMTSNAPALVSQRVLVVLSQPYGVVFGPSASTTASSVVGPSMSKPVSRAAIANNSTSRSSTVSYPTTKTTPLQTTSRPVETIYASCLVPEFAAAANLSNYSRIDGLRVFSDKATNQLVVEFTILDGANPSAAEAVANLKRSTLSSSTSSAAAGKRRRRRDTQPLFVLVDMYNQTLQVARVVSWTDDGPCPIQRCPNNGICRGLPSAELYCTNCSTPGTCSPSGQSTPSTSSSDSWSCSADITCIVPAIAVPVGLLLLAIIIILIVLAIITLVRAGREREQLAARSVSDNGQTGASSATNRITNLYEVEINVDSSTLSMKGVKKQSAAESAAAAGADVKGRRSSSKTALVAADDNYYSSLAGTINGGSYAPLDLGENHEYSLAC